MMAMSVGPALLTGRSTAEVVAVVALAVNAPNNVEVKGLPIALAISWVNNVPEAPTKVPATNNKTLSHT